MSRSVLAAVLGGALLAFGCASTIRGTTQTVTLETLDQGSPVRGASCELANDKGSWTTTSPGSVEIARSAGALTVRCESPGFKPALARVHPGQIASRLAGAIDKAVDTITESSRADLPGYPSVVRLEFGRSIEIGKPAR